MTPVIFHAALAGQRWPRCSQPSLCPWCHHNSILLCTGSFSMQRLPPVPAKCSVTSFRSPHWCCVNGHRAGQEFGQAQSQRGGNLTKTPASAVAVPKADREWEPQPGWSRNGAHWQWHSCKSQQSPGSSAKKSLFLYWLCGSTSQKCGCPFLLG